MCPAPCILYPLICILYSISCILYPVFYTRPNSIICWWNSHQGLTFNLFNHPTIQSTNHPTIQSTNHPTIQPSNQQTIQPSNHPINKPSNLPSNYPTIQHQINKPSNHPTVWQPAIQHSGNQPSNSLATNHIISLQTIFFNPTIQPFGTYTFNRLATTPANLLFTKSSNKLASNHPTV